MPKAGFPLAVDILIILELARGPAKSPELLRRIRRRLAWDAKLHYGTYYPALIRLYEKSFVCWRLEKLPKGRNRGRPPKLYALTSEGAKEVRRLSGILHRLILPLHVTA